MFFTQRAKLNTHMTDLSSKECIPRSLLPDCSGGPAICPNAEKIQQLKQQIITDPLTGLYNSAHLRTVLANEIERSQRTYIPTALVMLDLDHFKQVNDSYGHEAGNAVLIQTAKLIQVNTRQLDIQCRYGGEEFAIVLPSTERFLAIQVAERIRESIANTTVEYNQQQLQVTASIGLAFYQPGESKSVSSLINEADKYLYQAKEQGRNQVRYTEFKKDQSSAVSHDEKEALHNLFSD